MPRRTIVAGWECSLFRVQTAWETATGAVAMTLESCFVFGTILARTDAEAMTGNAAGFFWLIPGRAGHFGEALRAR